LPPGKREYLLYLPLYNGTASVEIGLPKAAVLEKGPAGKKTAAVVFCSTSITQAVAHRDRVWFTAIIGRVQRPSSTSVSRE
jgi:hypothetical protein